MNKSERRHKCPSTITELDTLRADKMHELLNEEGQKYIWQYDITTTDQALHEAVHNQDFDNMMTDSKTKKRYCLVGYGICDSPFDTPEELIQLVEWLCGEKGYLGCYRSGTTGQNTQE